MGRIGYVYANDSFAGIIREIETGYEFTYEVLYVNTGKPIGYNFPFSELSFFSRVFFPLFENLISEGWLLELQSEIQHVDKSDSFGLLLQNGADLIGFLTVLKDMK